MFGLQSGRRKKKEERRKKKEEIRKNIIVIVIIILEFEAKNKRKKMEFQRRIKKS